MDKLDIVAKCLLGFAIFLFVILTICIAIDINDYQNPETNLNKSKIGEYLRINGVVKSYLGETSVERLLCTKGCIITYETKQAYIIEMQKQDITVLFHNKQEINDKIVITAKVHQNYFDT